MHSMFTGKNKWNSVFHNSKHATFEMLKAWYKIDCSHLELTASTDLRFPTNQNFSGSELISKASVSKRIL